MGPLREKNRGAFGSGSRYLPYGKFDTVSWFYRRHVPHEAITTLDEVCHTSFVPGRVPVTRDGKPRIGLIPKAILAPLSECRFPCLIREDPKSVIYIRQNRDRDGISCLFAS